MNQPLRRTLPFLLLTIGLTIVGSRASLAQNTNSGDLRGTALDSTGAVVPGVTVTVLDLDKGFTRTYTTDRAGLYDTGPIQEDHYRVTFTKTGFKTYVRGPITVSLGIQTVNAEMEVGSVTQQVTVTTQLPLLDTESGAQSDTLTASSMDELPQIGSGNGGGADWENFIVLQPGESGTPENANNVANQNVGQASINGNMPFEYVLQDGATTTLPMSQNSDVTIFETTAEVKISSSAFSAQSGLGNIIYNQITKSGTDHFHGELYEYLENNFFNAASYGFGSGTIPVIHLNNFGGNIGGPVLPKRVFHKSYFFFDYDRTINNSTGNVQFYSLPSNAEMAGDFSQAGLPTLYDPTTQTIVNTGNCVYSGPEFPGGSITLPAPCVQRQSFEAEAGHPGDHSYNKIPTSMINPSAQAIQKAVLAATGYPQNVPTYSVNNFSILAPESQNPFIKWFGRWDTDVTSNNRVTATETESNNPELNLTAFCPFDCQIGDVSRDNAQVSDTWTISSNVVNEARMGFTDQLNYFQPLSSNDTSSLQMPLLKYDFFPNISIADNYYGPGSATNAVYKEFVFDPSDVVTLVKGRHVLHFGGEFLINRADSTAWGNINSGSFSFNGYYTSAGGNPTSSYDGTGYADFLLGQSGSWSAQVTPEYGGRWKSPQLFVQDDFKMRPNLTVNMGLRWEGETGWSEVHGNEAVWDPAVQNFNVSSTTINGVKPGTPVLGGMWYGFIGQNGRTSLQHPKYNIFLPRLGFSWSMLPNTVLRGGIGIFASTWSEDTYGAGMGNAFGQFGNDSDTTNGICPVTELNGNGSAPDTTDPGCGVAGYNSASLNSLYLKSPDTPWAYNGQSVSYNEYHTPVPTNYQWTLSLERQFLTNWMASIAYVGNHGDNLNFPVDINQVPENELSANDIGNEPYPLFQGINGSTNNAVSNYNAMEIVVTKNMANGLQLSANYTWSHFLDDLDSSGWGSREGYQNYQNAYLPAQNYSRSNFDIRHMVKGEAVYDLPFGRGRRWMNKNIIADEFLGGWETSWTWDLQTGNPIGITTGYENSSNNQSGSYTQYANLIGNYKTTDTGPDRTGTGQYHSLKEWYNLDAFAVPAAYTYGDFRRNIVSGPDLVNFDFALAKNFDVYAPRNVVFQLRGMASNIFNHPSFGQPGGNVIGAGPGEAQITGVTVNGRTWEFLGRLSF